MKGAIDKRKAVVSRMKQATKIIRMLGMIKQLGDDKSNLTLKCNQLETVNTKLLNDIEELKKKSKKEKKKIKRKNSVKSSCSGSQLSRSNSIISKRSRFGRKNTTRSRSPIKPRKNHLMPKKGFANTLKRRSTMRTVKSGKSNVPRKSQLGLVAVKNTIDQEKKDQEICYAMIKKIRHLKIQNSNKLYPKKTILRTITTIYKELQTFDDSTLTTLDFPLYVFHHYIKEFGKHKKTEKKFLKFLKSLKNYHTIIRISVFCKFMQLYEFANYSSTDVKVRI